jgi:hypothetical protein
LAVSVPALYRPKSRRAQLARLNKPHPALARARGWLSAILNRGIGCSIGSAIWLTEMAMTEWTGEVGSNVSVTLGPGTILPDQRTIEWASGTRWQKQ